MQGKWKLEIRKLRFNSNLVLRNLEIPLKAGFFFVPSIHPLNWAYRPIQLPAIPSIFWIPSWKM
jgi:hypothetical protein